MTQDPNAEIEAPETDKPEIEDVDNPVVSEETDPTDKPEGPDAGELAAGYLRHSEFTRRMQSMAEEKRQTARERAEAQELKKQYEVYKEWEDTLRADPDAYEQVAAIMQSRGVRVRTNEQVDSVIRTEIDGIKSMLADQKREAFINNFAATASRIATESGISEKDMQAIIAEGIADEVIGFHTKPENLAKVMTKLVKAAGYEGAKATASKELASAIRAKGKMASPKGSGMVPVEKEPDYRSMTQDERVAAMLKLAQKAG